MTSKAIQFLAQAARAAPSPDNNQPWHLDWDGRIMTIRYDRPRLAGRTFGPDHHATLIAIGAAVENVLQAADSLGMSIRFESSDHVSDGIYGRFTCEDSPAVTESAWDHPLFSRHTNRHGFERTEMPDALAAVVGEMREGTSRVLVHRSRSDVKAIARLVECASRIRFQTAEIHEWLARSLRYSQAEVDSGDGLDVRTLALPPGGVALLRFTSEWQRMARLNRLGVYRMFAKIEAQSISKAAAILVFAGKPGDHSTVISAGRLMERVWIFLNANGIAVHPYYVVADQLLRLDSGDIPRHLIGAAQSLRQEMQEMSADPEERWHIMFRVRATRTEPVRSKRLPIDRIYSSRV